MDQTPTRMWRAKITGPIRGGVVAGRYRLEGMLAKGGMGSVWRAVDMAKRAPVALKFMDPEIASSEILRKRFDREAKSAASLRTPHVVEVLEHGVAEDVPYIVMELLEGEDLQRRLRRERRIPLRETVEIAHHIAKGLHAAHEAGIVHRDLKPQNIFLAVQGERMTAKVLDFGVAKVLGSQAVGDGTKTGVVVGSPHYMSPEQARGLPSFDHRSDLWSFGVILFKMVTGHRPFKGEVAGDIIVKICADPLPIPSQVRPNLVPEIDAFFARALERDPDKRFQSAPELAAAFQEAAEAQLQQPIAAAPATEPSAGSEDGDATSPAPPQTGEPQGRDSSAIEQTEPMGCASNPAPRTLALDLGTPASGIVDTGPSIATAPSGSLRPSELAALEAEDQRRGTRNVALIGGMSAAGALVLLMLALAATSEPVKRAETDPAPSAAAAARPKLYAGEPALAVEAPSSATAPASASAADEAPPPPNASARASSGKLDEGDPPAPRPPSTRRAAPGPRPRPRPSEDWGY